MAPKSLTTILKEAGQRLEQYDFGSALQLYRQALAAAPDNAAAAMGLAMTLNRTGKPADALLLLQKVWQAMSASEAKPSATQQASVLAQMGMAQEQVGKLADALEAYRAAARLVRSNELQGRIAHLEPLVNSPLAVQQLILSARKLQAHRRFEEAAKAFRAAMQLQPDNAEVLHGLAAMLRALGQSAEAMPLLQKAVMLAPDRADLYNDMGLLFQDRLDFAKAVSFHKRAIKIEPKLLSAHINAGVALKRLGKMEESEAAYRQGLEIDPRSPEAHNNLGNLLRAMGRLPDAKDHLQQALTLRPTYEAARANLEAVSVLVEKAADETMPSGEGVAKPRKRTAGAAVNKPARTPKSKT